jgi:hypothetical protein
VSNWIDMTDRADGEPVLCEHLHCDDGRCLGGIVRYYGDGPTYAWGQAPGCAYLEPAKSAAWFPPKAPGTPGVTPF